MILFKQLQCLHPSDLDSMGWRPRIGISSQLLGGAVESIAGEGMCYLASHRTVVEANRQCSIRLTYITYGFFWNGVDFYITYITYGFF